MNTMTRNTTSINVIGNLRYYIGLWSTRFVENVVLWQRRHQERRFLMTLDERTLKDIGLTRADIDAEASKPFWLA